MKAGVVSRRERTEHHNVRLSDVLDVSRLISVCLDSHDD